MKFKADCHKCFAALSTQNRIEIVKLLQVNQKLNVSEIVKHFKLAQPTITHHLKYLEQAGVLESKKEGKFVFYYLHPFCPINECNIF